MKWFNQLDKSKRIIFTICIIVIGIIVFFVGIEMLNYLVSFIGAALLFFVVFLRFKAKEYDGKEKDNTNLTTFHTGKAISEKIEVNLTNINEIRKTFIAFDVETTGLNAFSDRIVEIGAVLFVDEVPIRSFGTLVNPKVRIDDAASAVNNITNDMLKNAPSEQEVFSQLTEFLGEALKGNIIMCAHNASFDFGFLCNTLSRLGYDAKINYVDTLSLSRKYIKGIVNYKQETVGGYFGLKNDAAHRAESDSEICGKILCGILGIIDEYLEGQKKQIEKMTPNKRELEVYAFILNIIAERGCDTKWIRYRKNSSTYIDVACLYTFLKFKFAKKGSYIIVGKNAANGIGLPTEPCNVSEGGTTNIRVYFTNPFDLKPLSNYIFSVYSDCYNSMKEYMNMSNYTRNEAEKSINMLKTISKSEMEDLLLDARNREYENPDAPIHIEQVISIDDVVINGIHNRVLLNEIRNIGDAENGFKAGYPYWERGETARRNGEIDEAIAFFDKARYNGYDAPALYDSYAKAYRKIKDYDNEIIILEEGILRKKGHDVGALEARRDKAIKLLFIKQEADRVAKEKTDLIKINKKENVALKSSIKRGRQIIQMTDDGVVIKEFKTIASAVKEVGVSSKSIRDAANGVQKHAGGYCWKYKE